LASKIDAIANIKCIVLGLDIDQVTYNN